MVLSLVPQQRLMVVRTNEIAQHAHSIARFAGLPKECIRTTKTHQDKNPSKFGILEKIDMPYLESLVHKYCSTLLQQYFPHIRSLTDSLG